MIDQLNKINKLKSIESFVQVNFVKGYKYVDRAGELVNFFYIDDAPKFAMNLRGLTIYTPNQKIEEIKVSSESFWVHFIEPESLDLIEHNVLEFLPKTLEITEGNEYK